MASKNIELEELWPGSRDEFDLWRGVDIQFLESMGHEAEFPVSGDLLGRFIKEGEDN